MGWDSVVRRLNEVCGDDWGLRVVQSSVGEAGADAKGKARWLAQVTVDLSISSTGSTRSGVGAALMGDPDDAIKTAQAEALKKAGNQFGMALELWTEEGREVVARGRAVASGDLGALKREVFERALAGGAEATPESVAEHFNIDVEELQNKDTLLKLLEA